MRTLRLAAIAAITFAFAAPLPALAQNDPFIGGDYVSVTSVSIDDGHYMDYASFLSGFYKDRRTSRSNKAGRPATRFWATSIGAKANLTFIWSGASRACPTVPKAIAVRR